eukprot:TRINITY_DN66428_c9_g1_i1.p1 TRINITY_DN66428_c9_g1~~TRINITY_DN66428_c9_g1_i1.p1  ORF type:complete len:1833 (+),score=1077.90 TRINITY_DN66428_c9_g1_i1:674-5500(+)
MKVFPNSFFNYRIDQLDDALPSNRVDPSSILLKNTPKVHKLHDHDEKSAPPVVKEVLEFPAPNVDVQVPWTHFVNLLYVYPEEIGFQKYRNIACRVQMRQGDDAVDAEGLKVLLGKSSCAAFTNQYITQVNYHNRSPRLRDEVKVMLPLSLTSKMHLFFTFYQVACKKKAGKAVAEVIGYAALPLYRNKCFVANDTYELQVASALPSNYLAPYEDGKDSSDKSTQFYSSSAGSFKVRLRLVSSVFHQDPAVGQSINTFPSDAELTRSGAAFADSLLWASVGALADAKPQTFVQFLPAILNWLLCVICTSERARDHAFVSLCWVLNRVNQFIGESGMRNSLLSAYVAHRFMNVPGHPAYIHLVQVWKDAIDKSLEDDDDEDDHSSGFASHAKGAPGHGAPGPMSLGADGKKKRSLHEDMMRRNCNRCVTTFSWFFFDIIHRSLVLDSRRDGASADVQPLTQYDLFVDVFTDAIDTFVSAVAEHSRNLMGSKRINQHMALFFRDMFAVLERDLVMTFIQDFVTLFESRRSTATLSEMQLQFFDVLFDDPALLQWLDLSSFDVARLCREHGVTVDEFDDDVMGEIRRAYPVCDLLVTTFCDLLSDKHRANHKALVDPVRVIFTRHDFDARCQKRSIKTRLATAYAPLLPSMSLMVQDVQKMDPEPKRQALVCFLWVLKFCDHDVLRMWWRNEQPVVLEKFLKLVAHCVVEFRYRGFKVLSKMNDNVKSILSPESAANLTGNTSQSAGAGATTATLKSDIEALMSNMHKKQTWARSGSKGTAPRIASRTASRQLTAPVTRPQVRGGTLDRNSRANLRQAMMSLQAPSSSTFSGRNSLTGRGSISGGGTAGRSTLREMRAAMAAQVQQNTLRRQKQNTLTLTSRDFLKKLLDAEGSMTLTVSRSVANTLSMMIDAIDVGELDPAVNADLSSALVDVLVSLLQNPQVTRFWVSLYPTVLRVVHQHADQWFQASTMRAQLRGLSNEVFRHSTMDDETLRRHTAIMLYELLKRDFFSDKSMAFLQRSLTSSLSKMVPQLNQKAVSHVKALLVALPMLQGRDDELDPSRDDEEGDAAKFLEQVEMLLVRMRTILLCQLQIMNQEQLLSRDMADVTTCEHLFMKVADAFNHIPEVRIQWLHRLAKHQEKHERYAEAGQCYVAIAELETQRMVEHEAERAEQDKEQLKQFRRRNPAPSPSAAAAAAVAKGTHTPLTDTIAEMNGEMDATPKEAVADAFQRACKALSKAKLFEQCYAVYKRVVPLYESDNKYAELSSAFGHLSEVFNELVKDQRAETVRFLGTYYRVGFFGSHFGQLNGKEFVYKMPRITQLGPMSRGLQSLYSKQLGVPVKILPSSKPVVASELNPQDCWLQITYVQPYFTPEELAQRQSFIDRNTDVTKFMFSTPFTPSGKPQGDVTEQCKRNTVLYVKHPFPYIKTAQRVVRHEDTILQPVESAIDDIEKRISKMNKILAEKPISAKSLTGLLQGSVATQVNGGAIEVVNAFFKKQPEADSGGSVDSLPSAVSENDDAKTDAAAAKSAAKPRFSEASLSKLRDAIHRFLASSESGLLANDALAKSPDEKAFQANLRRQFKIMCNKIEPLLKETKKKRRKRRAVHFSS